MKILFGFFIGLIAAAILTAVLLIKPSKPVNIVKDTISHSPTTTPFMLKDAPSQSLKGRLHILADDVLFEDRIATQAAKINEDTFVQQGEHVETGSSGRAKVAFVPADIEIFPDTSIDIVQTLPVNLVFNLSKGKIIIQKLSDKTISVRSKHLLVDVAGKIDIEISKDKPLVKLSVASGSATLAFNNLKYETQSLTIKEGQTVTYNDSTRRYSLR